MDPERRKNDESNNYNGTSLCRNHNSDCDKKEGLNKNSGILPAVCFCFFKSNL